MHKRDITRSSGEVAQVLASRPLRRPKPSRRSAALWIGKVRVEMLGERVGGMVETFP